MNIIKGLVMGLWMIVVFAYGIFTIYLGFIGINILIGNEIITGLIIGFVLMMRLEIVIAGFAVYGAMIVFNISVLLAIAIAMPTLVLYLVIGTGMGIVSMFTPKRVAY